MKKKRMTDAELREWYDKTSMFEQGKLVQPANVTIDLKPRRLVALRLEDETLASVKRLAAQKGLNYSTLMRMWITERVRREDKPRRA